MMKGKKRTNSGYIALLLVLLIALMLMTFLFGRQGAVYPENEEEYTSPEETSNMKDDSEILKDLEIMKNTSGGMKETTDRTGSSRILPPGDAFNK